MTTTTTPLPWASLRSTNSSSSCCEWHGVKCAISMHVIEIDLDDRALRGSLLSEFPPFPYLQVRRLSRNKLTGSLPRLNKLPLLKKLYLMKNKFKTIPPGFFQGLSNNLQVLMLAQNPFLGTWTTPLELSKFHNLRVLSAYNTNLEGSIPDIFDSLALTSLGLEENNLTGSLPPSLWISQIQELFLFDQKVGLTGTIDILSNMNSLSTVALGNNKFTGTIPDLSNCKSLLIFALGYSQFTGTIPDLSNCRGLRLLELRYNYFTGVVPQSLGSYMSLEFIFADHNMLQGPFPSFMLIKFSMILYNNYCTDTGDPYDFQVTTLLEIASAWMYPYKLSLGWKGNDACRNWSFVKCDEENNVTEIDLWNQRRLQGTISPAFGNLTGLQYLNLSDNNLIGSIPECLTKLPNLKVLDVSNNNLSGIIPSFASSVKLITHGNDLLIRNTTADAPNASSSPPKGMIILASIIIFSHKETCTRFNLQVKEDA
ncbi:hypothetical protein F3Y22_tig00110187pilonHSYRG00288 [Hibiscus syriacus]|uniref:Leucine-rich repeat-containing N-terminal plant-type domain-containing protein n=1 Tax=Hibiscus syriacus TaxID=106335 RepID=A0A6A3BHK6_HIBSY|nr:hypothetical protein F3Y22_tig00110187pilonHSYRG00288 [Hibiscus syriacus]